MPVYEITCEETWISTYRVRADTLAQAVAKLEEGVDPLIEERSSEKSGSEAIEAKEVSR